MSKRRPSPKRGLNVKLWPTGKLFPRVLRSCVRVLENAGAVSYDGTPSYPERSVRRDALIVATKLKLLLDGE